MSPAGCCCSALPAPTTGCCPAGASKCWSPAEKRWHARSRKSSAPGPVSGVIERFFALDGKRYHEFGLYFLIALPASIPTTGEFDAFDPHYRLIMQWLPLKDLPPVVPIFLRTALLNPPDVPVLVVCDEIGLPNASGPCVQ